MEILEWIFISTICSSVTFFKRLTNKKYVVSIQIKIKKSHILNSLFTKHISEPVHLSGAVSPCLICLRHISGCFIIMCNKELNRAALAVEKTCYFLLNASLSSRWSCQQNSLVFGFIASSFHALPVPLTPLVCRAWQLPHVGKTIYRIYL